MREQYYIYRMFDKNNKLLYLGKTTNFKRRLGCHFSKSIIKDQPWKLDVEYIKVFEVKTRCDMDMLEIYLIGKERPLYNVQYSETDVPKLKINYKEYNVFFIHNPLKKEESIVKYYNLSNKQKEIISSKLNICDHKKLNSYDDYWGFSYMWYSRLKNEEIKRIQLNLYNYFTNVTQNELCERKWTTYSDMKKPLSGRGYKKGFIEEGSLLNIYNSCKSYAYLLNNFPSTIEKELANNCNIDENFCSIFELVKIVKYITIDMDNELNIYITSIRIRTLFKDWLYNEDNFKEIEIHYVNNKE